MIITEVIAKDFLSFGEMHLELPRSGLVLVTGEDQDLGRANGAGKSSIMNALVWCLYGEQPRDIKVEELIRRGQASCYVTVKFEVDAVKYTVTRRRPSGLELVVAGEKQKGNPKFIQSVIQQVIGLSYDQFLITSYFPQKGDSSRFLKQNDAAAKDFLGTILNFNKTEAGYKKLHQELKELENLASAKRAEVSTAEQSVLRFTSIVDMPIPPMPPKEEVLAVKNDLDLVILAVKSEPDTSVLDAEITKVQMAVEKVKRSGYEREQIRQQIKDKQHKMSHLQESQSYTLTCPACSADLLESNGGLVEYDEESAEQVKNLKIEAVQVEIESLKERYSKLSPLVEKEPEFIAKLDKLRNDRYQARLDYEMNLQKKAHLNSKLQSYRQAILAHQQSKEQKDKINKELADLKQFVVSKGEELKSVEIEVMLTAAAKAVLSPTGAIAYSLDSIMGDLNDEVGQYLDIFSHNTMTYRISSGDDKAKVTHHVTKGGIDVSVGSLSGGEERGLILSVDLGLGQVIAGRNGVSLPSVMMLDECFEGLDYVGKEKVIDALREISTDRCIVVIDHSTEFNALFDKSVKVIKKSDVSRLEVS